MKRILLLLSAALITAACGGSSTSSTASTPAATSAPTQTISITESEFKIDPPSLSLKAGTYSFAAQNTGKFPHDLHFVSQGTTTEIGSLGVMKAGESQTAKLTFKAGTYTYFCGVDGHRDRGMQGTLTVTS